MLLKVSQNSKKTSVPESFFFNKETLAQVFFSEFCEIFKNTFFIEHHWTTASGKGHANLLWALTAVREKSTCHLPYSDLLLFG